MASLRAEIAELRRRLLAMEARQLAWRYNAAGNPGAGDCWNGEAFEWTTSMQRALDALQSAKRNQLFTQVVISLCDDDKAAIATAFCSNGTSAAAWFDKPHNFDALVCRNAFEAHLNVE
jgi:hypothetical protein